MPIWNSWGDEEQRADDRDELEEDDRVGGGEAAAAEVGQRQHRVPGAPLPGQERGHQRCPRGERAGHLGAAPADRWRPYGCPGQREQPGHGQGHAGQVQLRPGATAFGQPQPGQPGDGEPDRDVEPEDPLPGQSLDDRAADDRAGSDAQPGDAAPEPDGGAALVGRERVADQRQGQRDQHRRPGALDRARGDEHPGAR